MGNPLNVLDFGAVGDGATNNLTAFTNAINAANAGNSLVYVPEGDYRIWGGNLPAFTTSRGMYSDGAPSTGLRFEGSSFGAADKTGDCIVLRGTHKTLRGMSVTNPNAADRSTPEAVVRIRNCAYGVFTDLNINTDGNNTTCLLLEQAYDGSADDAYLIAHLGSWYNVFRNITTNYVAAPLNKGNGISFAVDSSAVGVVNPPGQAPGTYSGGVGHNVVDGFNIEGKARALNLDRAGCNVFTGGQFLGSATQVYGRNAAANVFLGNKFNQWITAAFNLDSRCRGNYVIGHTLFNVTPQPWSLGTLGELPVVLSNGEGMADRGLQCQNVRAMGAYLRPDAAGMALELGNGTNRHFADYHQFFNAIGNNTGTILLGPDAGANLYRFGASRIGTDGKFVTRAGLCVGNSTTSSATGSIVRKMQVFDENGTSLGYVPIYNSL